MMLQLLYEKNLSSKIISCQVPCPNGHAKLNHLKHWETMILRFTIGICGRMLLRLQQIYMEECSYDCNKSTWKNVLTIATGLHGRMFLRLQQVYMEECSYDCSRTIWKNVLTIATGLHGRIFLRLQQVFMEESKQKKDVLNEEYIIILKCSNDNIYKNNLQ